MGALIVGAWAVRHKRSSTAEERETVAAEHWWMLLYLSYVVLPPCAMTQFRALNCNTLPKLSPRDRVSFLRADASVSCLSARYRAFVVVNAAFIAVYQSIPVCWLVALVHHVDAINPKLAGSGDYHDLMSALLEKRKEKRELRNLSFLWRDYGPTTWWYEVADM